MRPLIPFVHQLSVTESHAWLSAFGVLLPACDIRLFEQLTAEEKAQVQIAIVANPKPEELMQLPQLKWVHSVWAGVERMLAELRDAPFAIVRLIDPHLAATMAEAVLAWVLYLHRDMPRYRQQQSRALWQQHAYTSPAERHVALLGLGELGQASAQRLRQNGFRVSGWSRTLKALAGVQCYAGEAGLNELLAQADIIVNLLPLTVDTRGLMNGEFFQRLKPEASVINFGRGATLNEADLLVALDAGRPAHAVLDVFDQEPLPVDSPLWTHPQITLLPHISAATCIQTASQIVARNIHQYLAEAVMPPVVDKQRGY